MKGRLNVPFVGFLALDHENLPRCLAALGFNDRVATVTRGQIKWWQPPYHRAPEVNPALGGRAQAEAFVVSRRAQLGAVNRFMRDAPVYLMHRHDPEAIICLDASTGEWRSPDNAIRGDDLVSLASYMWGVGLAYACHRLARACGLAEAPTLNG